MKPIRRATFAANALRHKRRLPFQKMRINWDALTAISTAASLAVSLVVLYVAVRALRYTANQIEDFRKESQTQHFIERAQWFDSPEFRATRRALADARLNRAKDGLNKLDVDDAPAEMFDELDFCNGLGILARHGELSAYDAWGEFSFWLFPFYADAEPLIRADQKDAPASWSNCDYLMEQVKIVDKQEDAGKQLDLKKGDIVSFYDSEIEENKSRTAKGATH
jgi:hypothetical protein